MSLDDLTRDLTEIIAAEGLDVLSFVPDLSNAMARADLRTSVAAARVTLVLGAGASAASGIAEWTTLVSDAASAALKGTDYEDVAALVSTSQLSPTVAVRFLEHILRVKTAFRSSLARELYRNYSPSTPNATLDAVCELILGRGSQPTVGSVVTYNFDDLVEQKLETEIAQRGMEVKVHRIHSPETYSLCDAESGIRVYHVHGYLPYNTPWSEFYANPVVFSERDYHQHYSQYSFWANLVQLRMFTAFHCLFVGLSMTDPNLRRLLDHARAGTLATQHHAVVRAVDDAAHARMALLQNFVRKADLESLGVEPVWITDYGGIPAFLRSLM
jgi:hypothetical protein